MADGEILRDKIAHCCQTAAVTSMSIEGGWDEHWEWIYIYILSIDIYVYVYGKLIHSSICMRGKMVRDSAKLSCKALVHRTYKYNVHSKLYRPESEARAEILGDSNQPRFLFVVTSLLNWCVLATWPLMYDRSELAKFPRN